MSGAAAPVAAQSAPDPIARVRAFVAQFQRDAPSLVAHEDYVQNATYGAALGPAPGHDGGARDGSCTVDFGIDPRLGIRVPIKMTERYRMAGETIDAVARYSDFRSFTVSTTEKVGKPPGR